MDKDPIKIRHLDPPPELNPFIKKISVFESKENISFTQKLTPSPYNYFSYNHKAIPTSLFPNRTLTPVSRLMIAGIKTEEIYVKYGGELLQILFEFTASGFYYLFHQSPLRYKNKLVELNSIFSPKEVRELKDKLSNIDEVDEQIFLIKNLLMTKLPEAGIPNLYVEKSIELIEENHGNISIQDVVDRVEVCERQLNRKFKEIVGISPKKFSKILKLHYLIYLIQQKQYPLQEIAFRGFFYDRPHFTHTFKELTGMTPVEFINSRKHFAFKFFNSL